MTRDGKSLDTRTLTLLAALGGGVLVLSLAVLVPAWGASGAKASFDDDASVDATLAALDEREAELDALARTIEESRAEIAAARESAIGGDAIEDVDETDGAFTNPAPAVSAPAPFPRRSARSEAPPVAQPVARPVETPAVQVVRREPVFVTLGAGTPIDVELASAISSETSVVGEPVAAVVASDVVQDGAVVIAAGSLLSGRVEEAVSQKKIGGQARLAASFDTLELPGGESVPVSAFLALEGEKQTKKDAAIMAGSTAGGALLGRVLKKSDKSKGTLIGAVVGAAVGTAIAAKNEEVVIDLPAGSVASLELDAPVRLALTEREAARVASAR